jgi:elongator complex protein 3
MQMYKFNPENYTKELLGIYHSLTKIEDLDDEKFEKVLRKFPRDGVGVFSKDNVVRGFEYLILNDEINKEEAAEIIHLIRMKPTRTISGVTTVTVLTKPFACPGRCIFCPNDVTMPKSYIASEPGAQRAMYNRFSPYLQVYNRLQAYKNTGHPTEKIELLILGGTWSFYTEKYKLWFIHECFRAMNDFGSEQYLPNEDDKPIDVPIKIELQKDINAQLRAKVGDKPYNQLLVTKEYKELFEKNIVKEEDVTWESLYNQHDINSKGITRCVGLVLETRPDVITQEEVVRMRKLGATKIQIGIQTLNDVVSEANKRGEERSDVVEAFRLLRSAGFKIHAHMMPNLYKATEEIDLEVYKELFDAPEFKPDELKIYPTSVIKNTELYNHYINGDYTPYTSEELIDLISQMMEYTPEYCRLTRIIRDIPSTEIEAGNKTTNLREAVEYRLKKEGRRNDNIRAREIKGKKVTSDDLSLDIVEYDTTVATEYFLQYVTMNKEIAGFLRLSIPKDTMNLVTSELNDAAVIREVHVYGPSLELGQESSGKAQHLGLGTKLIEKAKEMTKEHGFSKLAVISSIGTREYYAKRGFNLIDVYQIASI